jgi:hypothetical protein
MAVMKAKAQFIMYNSKRWCKVKIFGVKPSARCNNC